MFIPKVNDVVKLKLMEFYTRLGLRANWQNFRVDAVGTTGVEATMLDGAEPTTAKCSIPIPWIEAPFGWKEVYVFHHTDVEQLNKVISWIPRGIAVWTNHDLGSRSVGNNSFSPADRADGQDWRFAGKATDILTAEECRTRFRVVREILHEQYEGATKIPNNVVAHLRAQGWQATYQKHHWDVWRDEPYWPPTPKETS
jgi:hypothetical protein